ncbi:MAG: hypothetical protein HOW73_33325 [Polyangiaceae bacterium]|nr:hypothetical protein [Polyangiaceae bacterium]
MIRYSFSRALLGCALTSVFLASAACGDSDPADGSSGGGDVGGGPGTGGEGTGGQPPDDGQPPVDITGPSFCDPAAWGGTVPDENTDVVIPSGKQIVVDCDATARTILVEDGATLVASRKKSSTLTVHGNIVVKGVVNYGSPADRVEDGVTAELIIAAWDDEATVGYPETTDTPSADPVEIEVIDADVGIWVLGSGILTAAGQPKKAWSKLNEGAGPGDPTFTVGDASGWRAGDRVIITPTEPSSVDGAAEHFDEGTIESVDGTTVTMSPAPVYPHDGCTDCRRRGEAANLTRNVVIRSLDDNAHGHILSAERGTVQLDGAELRWLGPERAGGPMRRSALYFLQQRDKSSSSYVRHTAIWGGNHGFIQVEESDGIEVTDVAGYDTRGDGFWGGFSLLSFRACSDLVKDCPTSAPVGVFFDDVLAARITASLREEDGLAIQYNLHGFACGAGAGTGCSDCVATGVVAPDATGFFWNNNVHLPIGTQTFTNNVSHHNPHGIRLWQNSETLTDPWSGTQVWTADVGLFMGAYGNAFRAGDIQFDDIVSYSVDLKAVPLSTGFEPIVRLEDVTLASLHISGYVIAQEQDQIFRNLNFDGSKEIAVSQDEGACESGDEFDPEDHDCIRNYGLFENVHFAAGTKPFLFGFQGNFHTMWMIRGYSSDDPAYSDLPADFDLYRADNEVDGGYYYEPFDAWLVPR